MDPDDATSPAAPVRAVVFDFYGTLARAVAWGPTFEEVFAARGLRLDEAALAAWGAADVRDGEEHLEPSRSREEYVAWERRRLRRRVEGCGVDGVDVESLAGELHTASKRFAIEAYDEAAGVLAELRRRDLVLGVCSNWDWDLDRAMDAAGLSSLVDVVVTSARAGARKPHPRIFAHVLEQCRVAPAEALFVGDTWAPDVEGARAAGLAPVQVCREGRLDGPADAGGVPRVTDLRGLLPLVEPAAPAVRRAGS